MRFFALFSILFLFNFTVLGDESTEQLVKMHKELNGSCSYKPTQKLKDDKKLSCVVSKLADRCNKIDDCYTYCLATNLDDIIGGGCAHACNYRNEVKWSLPESVQQCATE
jgi:hypothetical protein